MVDGAITYGHSDASQILPVFSVEGFPANNTGTNIAKDTWYKVTYSVPSGAISDSDSIRLLFSDYAGMVGIKDVTYRQNQVPADLPEGATYVGYGAAHDVLTTTAATEAYNAGQKKVSFTFKMLETFNADNYIFMLVGDRHVVLSADGICVRSISSTWQSSAGFPANFMSIYDSEGTLVTDKVIDGEGNTLNEGTVAGSLQAGVEYTVVFNLDGYANNFNSQGVKIQMTGTNARGYVKDVKVEAFA